MHLIHHKIIPLLSANRSMDYLILLFEAYHPSTRHGMAYLGTTMETDKAYQYTHMKMNLVYISPDISCHVELYYVHISTVYQTLHLFLQIPEIDASLLYEYLYLYLKLHHNLILHSHFHLLLYLYI